MRALIPILLAFYTATAIALQAGGPAPTAVVEPSSASVAAAATESRPAADPLAWTRLAGLPLGVFGHAAERVGDDTILVTGGINQLGATSDAVQRLDLTTGLWSQPAMLAKGRAFHVQVALADGRLLVAGGQAGQLPGRLVPLAEAELIDFAAEDGKRNVALPGVPAPAGQPTGHRLADGRIIVIGGKRASIFDPAKLAWTQHITLRQERQAHASVVLADGRVLVAGGLNQASFEVISVADGRSRLLSAKLPVATDDLRMVLAEDGRAWVLGGQDGKTGNTLATTWLLTVGEQGGDSGKLEAGPTLHIEGGQADAAVAQLGRWVVLAGGEAQQGNRDTEWDVARLLDRRKLKVFGLPAMSQPHDDAVAVAVGRRVIVLGGYLISPQFEGGPPLPSASSVVEALTLPDAAFDQGE